MLDEAILEQLTGHFSGLSSDFTLALSPSRHRKQSELRELLSALVSTSPKLTLREQGPEVRDVRFDILKDGVPTGIRFRAVPGGHEFSSLVLAILNADQKGKLPDPDITERIRALRGPIEVRTYVSLSCTNCPDVVQALNVMALLHGDLEHETIDGELCEDEVRRLGIQGVPSVVVLDRVIHVGRASLGDLLEALEERFPGGEPEAVPEPHTAPTAHYDVAVLGGGPAGISAAIYSARKGLVTALVGQQLGGQVKETSGIENLISVPYTEGPKLSADLELHLRAYPVTVLEHRRVETIELSQKKVIRLKGGESLTADALIVATGAKWRELGIPGEKEYQGRGVAFCPHCDGPFYRNRPVVVVGGGNSGVEAAIDLAGICSKVTLVEYLEGLKADEVLVRRLKSLPNVTIVTHARSTEVLGDGARVTGLRYQDRTSEALLDIAADGVFIQIGLVPNSSVVRELVDTNRFGEIMIDAHNRTSAPGVYAAGDVTTVPWKQIVVAMGEGAKAALSAFEDRIRSAPTTHADSPFEDRIQAAPTTEAAI